MAACVSSGYVLLQIVTNLYVDETYILYQCGTAPPAADLVPSGSKFFEIPLTSVALVETIPFAYLVGATSIAACTLLGLYCSLLGSLVLFTPALEA